MRKFTLGWVLSVAVLLPNLGTAQVFMRPNPYPQVTAANAVWQLQGDPVFHAGAFYYPAGPTIFFDGNVMNRTGTYEGVPFYEDATQTPFSVVYVPIGGNVVRPYERRREGELAGTIGSRAPSFPIQRDGEVSLVAARLGITGIITPPVDLFPPQVIPEAPVPMAATAAALADAGAVMTAITNPVSPRVLTAASRTAPPILQVWVPFEGTRWYSSGSAVSFSEDRFAQVGEHFGFPVYRAKTGSRDEIFIPSVPGGPLAPYRRNR
jgi:hypothetical protein